MTSSRPINLNHNHNASAPMMATNQAALPFNNIPKNEPTAMPITQLPQHQQYQQPQQGQMVSPVVSPIPPREQIIINPNHPVNLPVQLGSCPVNINHNTMAWQQQQQQLNTNRSHDCDENEKNDTNSDVSSIPWGSICPDPNYDPMKDPMNPENIDVPFVPPLEITIRVVKSRRRKTMGSYHSTTTHSTTLTPPQSSAVEEDQHQQLEQSDWLQSPEAHTTQTGSSSIPMLGLSNSFASDASNSNSFSGSADQFTSAEERMYLEEDLLELQEIQGRKQLHRDETKNRKGMVRREFNRRILRFKKKKTNSNNKSNDNNYKIAGENDNDDDASGNKIIIKLNIDDKVNTPELPKSFKKKGKSLASPFGGRIKHRRSQSMQMMIAGQENGC